MAETLNLGAGNWAVKKDSLLAYNSENGNFKPLPFDFTRASSATVVNKDGLIEIVGSGEPRIDFSNDSNGALLLEPQRTNLIPYSEDFTNASWVKLGAGTGDAPIITENYAISPEGVQNATRVQLDLNGGTGSSANQSLFYDDLGSKTGDYTRSVYIKSLTTDTDLYFGGTLNDFELITATTEWQRFDFKSTLFASSLYATIGLRGTTGSSDSADILIYGFQVEAGSYATSYIPTQGATATRVAEVCINENLNVDYSGDYTLYLEHETLSLTEYNQFQFRQETSISYIFRVGNSLNIGAGLYTAANTIGFNKFALSVTSIGSYKFYKNGVLLSSGSGLNANLETIKSDALGMNIKEIKLYNTALTDQELINLTTI